MRGRFAFFDSHPSSSISSNAFHIAITPTPPPLGKIMASGNSPPSCSNNSYAMVFFPSTRYGSLSVERSNHPSLSLRSLTMRAQSLIRPFTRVRCAPFISHSIRFTRGTSCGIKICASIFAAAAYAARALPAFPAEGMATFFTPNALATLIATEIPRALKDPVGFRPSSLIQTLGNSRLGRTGVKPSPSVTGLTSGRTSRYRQRFASRPARAPRVNFSLTFRSYRANRIPLSFAQTFWGMSDRRCAPHFVHSRNTT